MSNSFNNVLGQEVLDAVVGSSKRGWCRWLKQFFRQRQFEVEWDGKVREKGSANCNVGCRRGCRYPQWYSSFGWHLY